MRFPTMVKVSLSAKGTTPLCPPEPGNYASLTTSVPPLEAFKLPPMLADKTLLRSDMVELGRFTGSTDLMSHATEGIKLCFKYSFYPNGFSLFQEISIHSRLPPHPNTLLFDRLALHPRRRSLHRSLCMSSCTGYNS
jgi:hypothetical protein